VAKLLTAGAVIFVKTNVPQTMFSFECCNPLWGRTTNPYNDKYTSGGSSGGEAALLAMDGSAAGIGTDIGGSLRIPSAYCGIYSLKSGHGRISAIGSRGKQNNVQKVAAVYCNYILSNKSWFRWD
jgi:amidase